MVYDLDDPYDEFEFKDAATAFGPFRVRYRDGAGIIESPVFRDNLRKMDSHLPEILSDMVLYAHDEMETPVLYSAYHVEEENRYSYYVHGMYFKMVRAMLAAMAYGLNPDTPWTGREEVRGEYYLRDALIAMARFDISEIPSDDGLLLECSVILE